jgi:hypothetical protein
MILPAAKPRRRQSHNPLRALVAANGGRQVGDAVSLPAVSYEQQQWWR